MVPGVCGTPVPLHSPKPPPGSSASSLRPCSWVMPGGEGAGAVGAVGAGAAQCPGRAPRHPMAAASSTRCAVSERQPSPHSLLHPTTAGGNAFLEMSPGMRNDMTGVPCARETCAASPWATALPFLLARTHHGWGVHGAALTPSSGLHPTPSPRAVPSVPAVSALVGLPQPHRVPTTVLPEGEVRQGRRAPVHLLLNEDMEHSPAQESSCRSGRCHIPLQRPHSSPWYCRPSHRPGQTLHWPDPAATDHPSPAPSPVAPAPASSPRRLHHPAAGTASFSAPSPLTTANIAIPSSPVGATPQPPTAPVSRGLPVPHTMGWLVPER